MCQLEFAPFFCVSTSESTFLVSKEFALKQILRDRSTIDNNEWISLAWALSMDGMGDEFFTGAALTADQHRDVGKGNAFNKAKNVLHTFRSSNNPVELMLGARVTLM